MKAKTSSNQLPLQGNAKVISNHINSVTVDVPEPTMCSGCTQRQGCSHRRVQSFLSDRNQITLNTLQKFEVGEEINLTIDESYLLQGTFYVYCIPLIFLFSGAGLSMLFIDNELFVFIFSILSMIIGFLISSQLANKKERIILNGIKINKINK